MIDFLDKDNLTIDDINSLIENGIEESVHLDFKASGSLSKNDKKKLEIAKDVSAFANSDGGYIIYGIEEENHKASKISPIDGNEFTKEWLEQIIQTRIQRKIESVKIIPIRINGNIKESIYVIRIPVSILCPHMTSDKRFYKRYNFESVQMEEYEIRDLYNRTSNTKLEFDNIITKLGFQIEDEEDVFKEMTFQVKNIGNAIETNYKLIIYLNFRDYIFHIDPLSKQKNFNHSIVDTETSSVSFHSLTPIFPGEVLTIGTFKIGVSKHKLQDILSYAKLKIQLLYSNGEDIHEFDLKNLFYNN
ncbi:AlbA family DNA-binding domain-containing protein [Aestuariibaculum marinum]|uniref:ATP-binding protein n=1 Tax=Aestuariibaculum marinum TaxID=2683592 RepID=A0A8J6PYL7_9FLAO|nr:ATP-binding protein [Aestuariibaculum marinum]MBD0822647.1 ATP-binding protein [Aestuariibaculum marinum]